MRTWFCFQQISVTGHLTSYLPYLCSTPINSCLSIHSFTVTSFDLPFLPPLYCQMIQRKDLPGFLLDALQGKIAGKLIYEIELSNRQNAYEANEGGKEETHHSAAGIKYFS